MNPVHNQIPFYEPHWHRLQWSLDLPASGQFVQFVMLSSTSWFVAFELGHDESEPSDFDLICQNHRYV